ncbi:MAG: hypothetical protein RL538_134 [Candidatus Parcubacteria bacterium]|jgi:hypothetical protein
MFHVAHKTLFHMELRDILFFLKLISHETILKVSHDYVW